MDTRRRRSPLRILAPVVLIGFAVALALIISSAQKSGGGGSTSANSAEKARDLGTSTTKSRSRRHSSRGRLPKRIYVVQQGDTLGSIAAKTGVPIARLQELNPNLDQFSLQTGQRIRIR